MIWLSRTEERACAFASAAHARVGQLRRYTFEQYIVHPVAVAKLVRGVPHTEAMIVAALLHDTVEDTDITLEIIEGEFGPAVSNYVYWLTDISKPLDGNRAARKAIDRAHNAKGPAETQTIKVADLIDNAKTIFKYDPDFARIFYREKVELLDALVLADTGLIKLAKIELEAYTGLIH